MVTKTWENVAIIGVGLLGGSIGLALRERQLARSVIGVGRSAANLQTALRRGAITEIATDLTAAVANADLVIVCTPVADVAKTVQQVAAHSPSRCLITDVGSTKEQIVAALDSTTPNDAKLNGRFVGSHPIAGSEKSGAEHARGDLFSQRTVVVTPTDRSDPNAVATLEEFWKSLGANVARMTPREHDQAMAVISHVPHVVAAVLAAATPTAVLPLVGTGWLDTTRVAAGDVELWRQILTNNRDFVAQSLRDFGATLAAFQHALEQQDEANLVRLLAAGKERRDAVGN